MAITNTRRGPVLVKPDFGQRGAEIVRLTLDASATSATVTLPAESTMKTILDCVGGTSHNIPLAGVAATTGFTVKFAAGTNGEFLSLLLVGDGR